MILEYSTEKITLTHKITGLKVFINEKTTIAKWLDDKWETEKTQSSLFNY
jgi:hypothetical protein